MSAHTPGPWHVGGADGATIYDSMHQRVANSFEGVMVAHRSNDACKANARLIAAAPDMLAVATELLAVVEEEREDYVFCNSSPDGGLDAEALPYARELEAKINRARAAIVKATHS